MNAVQEIRVGDAEVVLTGGTESMSQAPYAVRNTRWGTKYGVDLKMEDTLAAALVDRYPQEIPMGMTAEKLGSKYGVTRQDCDQYALQSQQRWANAQKSGNFKGEISPVSIKTRKGVEEFAVDEHARPQTTIESLAKLPSVFKKDGLVTAGNASGISDGAAAVIVASEEAVKKYGLKPLARIVSYHVEGVEPSIMGIGPVPAIKGVLKKSGWSLKDADLLEVNEAFAAQYLAVEKELGLDRSITNTNGGAIALGTLLFLSCGLTHFQSRTPAGRIWKSHHGPLDARVASHRKEASYWICLYWRWPRHCHCHRKGLKSCEYNLLFPTVDYANFFLSIPAMVCLRFLSLFGK